MAENKLPPYVNSPHFTAIAEALDAGISQTIEFIEEVHKIAKRGKLQDILNIIVNQRVHTPDEVAQIIRRDYAHSVQRTIRGKPSKSSKSNWRVVASPSVQQPYIWDPDTGSMEPNPHIRHWNQELGRWETDAK